MKQKLLLVLLILLFLFGSSACNKTETDNVERPAPTEVITEETLPTVDSGEYPQPPTAVPSTPEGYPLPDQQPAMDPEGYPPPVSDSPPLDGSLLAYPEIGDGGELTWEQAQFMILQGYVSQVAQEHSQKVFLTLKDGRTLFTVEPNLDDVFTIIEECGEICQDIVIATE